MYAYRFNPKICHQQPPSSPPPLKNFVEIWRRRKLVWTGRTRGRTKPSQKYSNWRSNLMTSSKWQRPMLSKQTRRTKRKSSKYACVCVCVCVSSYCCTLIFNASLTLLVKRWVERRSAREDAQQRAPNAEEIQ